MLIVKKDGYILELFSYAYKDEEFVKILVYKSKWIFFKSFLLHLSYPMKNRTSLKDYVNSAIQEVNDVYN